MIRPIDLIVVLVILVVVFRRRIKGYYRYFTTPNIVRMRNSGEVDGLFKALNHRDHYTSRRAFSTLLEWKGPLPTRCLLGVLSGPSEGGGRVHKRWAVEELGEIGDRSAVDALIAALSEASVSHSGTVRGTSYVEAPDLEMVERAATALGRIGDRRAVQALIGGLGSKNWFVAGECAAALGMLGDPRGMTLLLSHYSHWANHCRTKDDARSASNAVRRIGQALKGCAATLPLDTLRSLANLQDIVWQKWDSVMGDSYVAGEETADTSYIRLLAEQELRRRSSTTQ